MTINLDYDIKLNIRGVEYDITLYELSPKESMELSNIFNREDIKEEDFIHIYNNIVGGVDKDKLLKYATDKGMLPQVVNKLLATYIDLKKDL